MQTRSFSKKTDESEDYSKKFESMLGKAAKPVSDTDKEALERQAQQKAERDAAQAELDEIERQRVAEKKAQDFDDLL